MIFKKLLKGKIQGTLSYGVVVTTDHSKSRFRVLTKNNLKIWINYAEEEFSNVAVNDILAIEPFAGQFIPVKTMSKEMPYESTISVL